MGYRSRYLNIVAVGGEPALPYLLGSTFRLGAGARPYRVVGYNPNGVCGALLPSPSGRFLMYGVSRHGWPALEVLDLFTGARFLFHAHACDPAWGVEDQIAYVHYVSFSVDSGGYGRIVVQHGLGGTPRAWTRDAAWTGPIWAGEALLASNDSVGGSQCPLEIIYGAGRQRGVDRHTRKFEGPCSTVVALNPQGTEALLDTQRLGPGGGGQGSEDLATLLRVSDGTVLSTVRIGMNEQGAVVALAPDGDWSGDEVITTGGIFSGGSSHPPAALVTLTIIANHVQLHSAKQFLEQDSPPMGQNLAFASQARFLDASGDRIAVWFGGLGHLQYVACDTVTERCAASRNYGDPWAGTAGVFVSNPSRP